MPNCRVFVVCIAFAACGLCATNSYAQTSFDFDDLVNHEAADLENSGLESTVPNELFSVDFRDDQSVEADDAFEPLDGVADSQTLTSFSDAGQSTFWFKGEYLRWWTNGNELPALVTTSPAGTPRSAAGVIGQPGTEILFGATSIDNNARDGFRATLGSWLDVDQDYAVEGTWFSGFDDATSGDFFIQSGGLPIVARPFFDTVSMQEASELTAYTDPSNVTIAEGSVNVRSSSEMHSASLALRRLYRQGSRGRVDLLAGYRYFRLREGLLIEEQVIARDPGGLVAVGTTFDLIDEFTTTNNFNGGEIGFNAEFYHDFMTLEILAKIAVGNLRRQTDIFGVTTVTAPPPTNTVTTTDGALLAQPTNSGRHAADGLAFLPELGVNLKVALTNRTTFTLGYTLLALDGVARGGEQIDRSINSNQIGGGTPTGNPVPLFAESTFCAQAISVGFVIER